VPIAGYTRCEVFSETERRYLGEVGDNLTAWLAEHPQYEVVEVVMVQSSDRSRHCLSAVAFLRERSS
jgi:hypothetical protein